ncbi:MAG TPA: c-type cytochrome [Oscillatoriaceae cyanobacterium]
MATNNYESQNVPESKLTAENKKVYDVEYKQMKKEGYPFHPFATWKDVTIGLVILCILVGLTLVWGVGLDAPADPTSHYLPRPEWYFMFLFELLKFFPGPTEFIASAVIPGILGVVLILLPFYDRNPYRSPKRRPIATTLGILLVLGVIGLTTLAYWQDDQDPNIVALRKTSEQQAAAALKAPLGAGALVAEGKQIGGPSGGGPGAGIFTNTCAMCHGLTGTQIPGVKLLDKSFLATVDVPTIVTNGFSGPSGQMPSFKGRLTPEQIKSVSDYLHANAK